MSASGGKRTLKTLQIKILKGRSRSQADSRDLIACEPSTCVRNIGESNLEACLRILWLEPWRNACVRPGGHRVGPYSRAAGDRAGLWRGEHWDDGDSR